MGGFDKGKNGHRVDSIPIANGVIKAGSTCVPMFYVHEFHEVIKRALVKATESSSASTPVSSRRVPGNEVR